jgi:hypothetical protein
MSGKKPFLKYKYLNKLQAAKVSRVAHIFQKSRIHVRILGAIRVT